MKREKDLGGVSNLKAGIPDKQQWAPGFQKIQGVKARVPNTSAAEGVFSGWHKLEET